MSLTDLRKIVDAHREAAGGGRREIDQEIHLTRKRWETFTKPDLKSAIRARKLEVEEILERYANEKAEYEAKIQDLRDRREQTPEYRQDALPDEVKIAAFRAAEAGFSTSKIRIALGFSDFNKTKELIEEGRILAQAGEEGW